MQCYERHADSRGRTGLHAIDAVPGEKQDGALPAHRHLLDLTEPTLLFLPGVQTVDGAVFNEHTAIESLESKSRIIENHLGGAKAYSAPLRFLGLTYSRDPKYWNGHSRGWVDGVGRTLDARRWAARRDSYYSLDAKRLGETIVKEALISPDGSLLPRPQLAARLSHLTMFADSYGSIFGEQLANVFRDIFSRKFGMNEPEVRELLQHVVLIGASNVPERNIGTNTFTGVYFEGRDDKMIAIKRDDFKAPVFSGPPSTRQTALVAWKRAGHLCGKGATLINLMLDRSHFETLDGAQTEALTRKLAEPYRPQRRDIERIECQPVDRGVVVHFNVPQHFDVLVHQEPPIGRHYANSERHHSYSYSYPLPGARDHADLLGRICRNAVRREAGEVPDWPKLLSRPHPNPALPPRDAQAIERQVSQIVLEQRGRLQRTASVESGAGHRESLALRQEREKAALPRSA